MLILLQSFVSCVAGMNTSKIDALAMMAAAAEASSAEELRRSEQNKAAEVSEPSTPSSREDQPAPSPKAAATAPAPTPSPAKTSPATTAQVTATVASKAPNANTDGRLLQAPVAAASSNREKKPSFTDRLHAILDNRNLNSIVSWLPSGKSFVILNKEAFANKILPSYFKEAKFDSCKFTFTSVLSTVSRFTSYLMF